MRQFFFLFVAFHLFAISRAPAGENEAARKYREAGEVPEKLLAVAERFPESPWGESALSKRLRVLEGLSECGADMLAAYRQYIQKFPSGEKVASAKRFIAEILYPTDKPKALKLAREVVDMPALLPNNHHREVCLYLLGMRQFEGKKDYAAARTWFKRCLDEHPNGHLAAACRIRLASSAGLALQQSLQKEEFTRLQDRLNKQPDKRTAGELRIRIARIQIEQLGHHEAALNTLAVDEKNEEESPFRADALYLLGAAYASVHSNSYDRQKAIGYWRRFFLEKPKMNVKAKVQFRIGSLLLNRPAQFGNAMRHFEQVTRLSPKSVYDARAQLAKADYYARRFFDYYDRQAIDLAVAAYWKLPESFGDHPSQVRQALQRLQFLQDRYGVDATKDRKLLMEREFRKEVRDSLRAILKRLESLEEKKK